MIRIREPQNSREHFSTGALDDFEQSLVINTKKGLLVVAGCSHPGVENIQGRITIWKARALVGGLHGFSDFALLRDLEMVCPTHCPKHKLEINYIFPQIYSGGAGKELFTAETFY